MRSEKEIREKLEDYRIAYRIAARVGARWEREIIDHIIKLLGWILEEE